MRNFLKQEEFIYQTRDEINNLLTGTVSIASYFSIATHWLPELILEFKKMHPGVNVQVTEGVYQEVIEQLNNKTADIGFATNHLKDGEYDWYPLYDDAMVAIVSQNHAFVNDGVYPIHQFEKEDVIVPVGGKDIDILLMLEESGVKPKITYITKENFSALKMAEIGLGTTMMNELILKDFRSNAVYLPIDPPQYITLGLLLPSYKEASPATKAFVKFAIEKLTQKNCSNT